MPISFVSPLPCGATLQIAVAPAGEGLACWRLLRRTDSDFAGPADPNAVVVAYLGMGGGAVDYGGLTNGTAYFYQLYSTLDGETLVADGQPVSGTPNATYQDAAADPQEVLSERISVGLAVEVARGNLFPSQSPKANGTIPVFTAPFALPDQIVFPCVTVHLENTDPSHRFIGDDATQEFVDGSGMVVETEGWLASFTFNVVGATLNPDERIALRKALRRIVQSNMPVFDAAGMVEISFSQSDSEQFQENAAPVFMTMGRFSCVAPAAVIDGAPPISTVSVVNTGT